MILDNSVELQIDYAVVGFIKQYEIQLRRCGKEGEVLHSAN